MRKKALREGLEKHSIRLTVIGKKHKYELGGELYRQKCPETVKKIYDVLPITGRVILYRGFALVEIDVAVGPEKPAKFVREGEILYWPLKKSLCISLRDMDVFGSMSPLGRITEGCGNLRLIENFDYVRIERAFA